MSERKIIYVNTGVATHEQLTNSLLSAKSSLERRFDIKIDNEIEVNVVRNRNDEYVGCAYVFIKDDRFIHAICGRNLDGSSRVERVSDKSLGQTQETYLSPSDDAWGDEMEASQQQDVDSFVDVQLAPLICLESYTYTPSQYEHLKSINKSNNPVPLQGNFQVREAYYTEPPGDRIPHILKAKKVPTWVTNEYIKNLFQKFCSEPGKLIETSLNDTKIKGEVPIVHRMGATLFVAFEQCSHDACMAKYMKTKVIATHPQNKQVTQVLTFNYADVRIKTYHNSPQTQVYRPHRRAPVKTYSKKNYSGNKMGFYKGMRCKIISVNGATTTVMLSNGMTVTTKTSLVERN